MHKQENIFFLVMLMSILFFGIIPFFKTESLTSASENRTLATFEHFDIESFSNGSFQSNFESALSDQFVLSEEIRTAYNKIFNNFSVPILSNQICKNNYLEFSGGTDYRRATFNCEDYILYYPEPLTKIQAENIAINIQKYNRVNQLTDTYYYIIQDSSAYNYKTNQPIIDYEELLKESLTGNYHLSSLDTSTYDSFKSYFYKTDHHWNHYGSYQGYLDIVNLLNLSPPPSPRLGRSQIMNITLALTPR